ncbi:unnamed protein product [marine sediment metagenome]|uniref:Uncharacterized protein n=1 Tax=marine sediment metagenome TaxID=412755 RepID=X1KXU1_9ZZZZ
MPLNNITAAQLEYFEIEPPAAHSPSVADTWEAWDISAHVPPSAKFAEIWWLRKTSNGNVGVRETGSSVERKYSRMQDECGNFTVACAGQAIECISGATANHSYYYVIGYWE